MSSSPLYTVYPDQLNTNELPNGTLAQAHYLREARNRQWAAMTAFGGAPFSFGGKLTNDTFEIKVLAPPYVIYAWPAVLAAGAIAETHTFADTTYKPGTVHFTVDTHDATYGTRLEVYTEGYTDQVSENLKDAQFVHADSIEIVTKDSVEKSKGALLQVAADSTSATWRNFTLNIEIPDGVTVYQVFLFWYHQVVS